MVETINVIKETSQETVEWYQMINWEMVITLTVIAIIGLIVFTIFYWIVKKIASKLKEGKKGKDKDYEFDKYTTDLRMIQINKDPKYKYRNPLTAFLFWKKARIFANTSLGKKFIGYYDGEAVKKEGFFIIGLEQRYSFFKRETDVLILPYQLRKDLIRYNDDFSIDIDCEGIDETMSSEYFSLPVFKNYSNKEKDEIFTDFSNLVLTKYFKQFVYRDVLKGNMIDFANNIREATEMNPKVPLKRKTQDDLS